MLFVSSLFAGYSSGGRSGYSRSTTSYSSGRSGYSRSTNNNRVYNVPRTYNVAPRNYAQSSNQTVVNNHHYSQSGGYGGGWGHGFGGGFFSGMLGGYIGGSLAQNHNPVVVANTAPVVAGGQGMMMEPMGYPSPAHGFMSTLILIVITALGIWFVVHIVRMLFGVRNNKRW